MTTCGHQTTTQPGNHHWTCIRHENHPEGQHHYTKTAAPDRPLEQGNTA